jgi:7-keto-8-aminopelargonate synthetase-like enzyme
MKNNKVNLVNDIFTYSRSKGITHLSTEDENYDGRFITINGRKLINFGLCSYFGLEVDQRLKDGAIEAINKYGIHYACSRTYVSCTLYKELEDLISQMFDAHVVLSTSLSLGHHSVMPIVIEKEDAIIMDQQVHASVQDAATKMQAYGVPVTILRHNDLDELKKK